MVYCWRSSSASANRKRKSSSLQNSSMVQKKLLTPQTSRNVRHVAPSRRSLAGHRAHTGKRRWSQAEFGVAIPLGCIQGDVVLVEKKESSPLTLKISALVLRPSVPSAPEEKRLCNRRWHKVVLVATPEIPLM